jgi:phytoene dehydrogenase-like protein
MKRYDAIVVGAGHNGLVAAAYLARAGLDVLVLERRYLIGGAAVSEELYPGFTYSTCSYVCSLLRPEIMRGLDLPRHGLQVIPYEGSLNVLTDGDFLASYSNHDRMRRELMRHSKRDAEAYDRYTLEILRQCKFIRPMLLQTPPDPTSLRPKDLVDLVKFAKPFSELGEKRLYETMRFWTMSIGDFLDEYFKTDVIKGHLAGSSIIGTALGPRSPGTAYVLLHHYMGEVDGSIGAWGYARGGMGAISNALAAAAQETGRCEIRCDSEVTDIIVKNGRVKGVALANGSEFFADTVVSNLDFRRTITKLKWSEALADELVRKGENFKIRGSSGKLNIALDRLPDFKGVAVRNNPAISGDIHYSPSLNYIERAYDDWKYGHWSKRPYLDIVIPSLMDPTMAPEGKHFMSVFVQYVPPTLHDGPWTPEKRDAFGETVISLIEDMAPGFRNLILHKQVRSPWEIENEVGLTEGNIFQGELTLDQLLFNRPVPGLAQYRGPKKGFYMCGSSMHPGGGVMGAPGYNAVREVLKDLHRGAPA